MFDFEEKQPPSAKAQDSIRRAHPGHKGRGFHPKGSARHANARGQTGRILQPKIAPRHFRKNGLITSSSVSSLVASFSAQSGVAGTFNGGMSGAVVLFVSPFRECSTQRLMPSM